MLSPHDQSSCRVVNMSKIGVEITAGGQTTTLAPAKMQVIGMDSLLKIGEFQLQLRSAYSLPFPAAPNGNGHSEPVPPLHTQFVPAVTTRAVLEKPMAAPRVAAPPPVFGPGPVGLAARLTRSTLTRTEPAEAIVTVANRGERTAVQIRLQVDGLPSHCFEVPPLPLLFPGAEKTLVITFTHPETVLKAGTHPLRFTAVAPEAYPGEQAVVQQSLSVPAHFAHTVTLRGPL
jgi:hypothetical protein